MREAANWGWRPATPRCTRLSTAAHRAQPLRARRAPLLPARPAALPPEERVCGGGGGPALAFTAKPNARARGFRGRARRRAGGGWGSGRRRRTSIWHLIGRDSRSGGGLFGGSGGRWRHEAGAGSPVALNLSCDWAVTRLRGKGWGVGRWDGTVRSVFPAGGGRAIPPPCAPWRARACWWAGFWWAGRSLAGCWPVAAAPHVGALARWLGRSARRGWGLDAPPGGI